jgi:hypothetical protein
MIVQVPLAHAAVALGAVHVVPAGAALHADVDIPGEHTWQRFDGLASPDLYGIPPMSQPAAASDPVSVLIMASDPVSPLVMASDPVSLLVIASEPASDPASPVVLAASLASDPASPLVIAPSLPSDPASLVMDPRLLSDPASPFVMESALPPLPPQAPALSNAANPPVTTHPRLVLAISSSSVLSRFHDSTRALRARAGRDTMSVDCIQ